MSFADLRIRALVRGLLAAAGLIVAATLAMAHYQDRKTRALSEQQAARTQALQWLDATVRSCDDMRVRVLAWTLTRRSAQRARYADARDACLSGVRRLAEQDRRGLALLETLERYIAVMEEIQSTMTDETRNSATAQFQRQAEPLSERIRESFEAWRGAMAATSVAAGESLQAGQRQALLALVGMNLVSVAFLCAVLIALRRKVVEPITLLGRTADRLAEGELTHAFATSRRDEFGDLMNALERVRVAWVAAPGRVRSTALSIQEAAGGILAGSVALSGARLCRPPACSRPPRRWNACTRRWRATPSSRCGPANSRRPRTARPTAAARWSRIRWCAWRRSRRRAAGSPRWSGS